MTRGCASWWAGGNGVAGGDLSALSAPIPRIDAGLKTLEPVKPQAASRCSESTSSDAAAGWLPCSSVPRVLAHGSGGQRASCTRPYQCTHQPAGAGVPTQILTAPGPPCIPGGGNGRPAVEGCTSLGAFRPLLSHAHRNCGRKTPPRPHVDMRRNVGGPLSLPAHTSAGCCFARQLPGTIRLMIRH